VFSIEQKIRLNEAYTHTHTDFDLGTKNISISDEAYSRLATRKGANESFTDVINRLTGKRSVLELAGILNESQSKEVRSKVRNLRKRSSKRILQTTIKRLS
jgi:predicted CopG family antitoxin